MLVMNDKGETKASDKPSKALAEAKTRKGSVHPVRRETITNKKPLRRLRGNPTRIHEGANRCESSLQEFSKLSRLRLFGQRYSLSRLKPRSGSLWLASTIAKSLGIQASRKELSAWVQRANAILNWNEIDPKYRRRLTAVWKTEAGKAEGSKQSGNADLRSAGNGGHVAGTGVQVLRSPRRNRGPSAR